MDQHKLIEIRHLTESTYILRFERNDFVFQTGQYLILGHAESSEAREYTIYSGENDDFLEVLIKEVPIGWVSKFLKLKRPGVNLSIDGPFGYFTLKNEDAYCGKLLFIASGTGISPFHSYIKTFPGMDYQILHGVRFSNEAYERDAYEPEKYILCTTGDDSGDFNGRVTDYLRLHPVEPETHTYLCGNSRMIKEVTQILTDQGMDAKFIHTEVYF